MKAARESTLSKRRGAGAARLRSMSELDKYRDHAVSDTQHNDNTVIHFTVPAQPGEFTSMDSPAHPLAGNGSTPQQDSVSNQPVIINQLEEVTMNTAVNQANTTTAAADVTAVADAVKESITVAGQAAQVPQHTVGVTADNATSTPAGNTTTAATAAASKETMKDATTAAAKPVISFPADAAAARRAAREAAAQQLTQADGIETAQAALKAMTTATHESFNALEDGVMSLDKRVAALEAGGGRGGVLTVKAHERTFGESFVDGLKEVPKAAMVGVAVGGGVIGVTAFVNWLANRGESTGA